MKKIIIFDMDGTIVNTKQDITNTINFVRKSKSLDPLPEDVIVNAINNIRNDRLSKVFYGTETFLPEDKHLFQSHYLKECTKTSFLYNGILESLEKLKSKGCSLSIATNAYTIFAEKILSDMKIDYLFDHIIGACKVNNPKPNPDMLKLILDLYEYEQLNDPKPIMIGDSHTDIEAGKNAAMNTVFVKWGFGNQNGNEDISIDEPINLHNVYSLFEINLST
jgi:phosphoglycolate phosphatase